MGIGASASAKSNPKYLDESDAREIVGDREWIASRRFFRLGIPKWQEFRADSARVFLLRLACAPAAAQIRQPPGIRVDRDYNFLELIRRRRARLGAVRRRRWRVCRLFEPRWQSQILLARRNAGAREKRGSTQLCSNAAPRARTARATEHWLAADASESFGTSNGTWSATRCRLRVPRSRH